MKRLELDITRCADCPYMDLFWHDDADGWCCKDEREIDDVSTVPDFCKLEDEPKQEGYFMDTELNTITKREY